MTATVAVPDGEVAVIEVALSAVTVAADDPKSTALAAARFVPVMVTAVPPACGPLDGQMPRTIGAGGGAM